MILTSIYFGRQRAEGRGQKGGEVRREEK